MGVARVPAAHARGLIERAYERTLAAGRTVPPEFARARIDLGAAEPPPAEHPALALAPPLPLDEAREQLGALHELAGITWVPPEAALQALDLELGQIATSRLIVAPGERAAQVAAATGRIADRSIDGDERARLAERLEETAYLLALAGRREPARLCTTAAALCRDPSVAPSANPFVRAMFDKIIRNMTKKEEP
jgi:hypothetical protein